MLISGANRIDRVTFLSNGAIRLRLITPYDETKGCFQSYAV
jgi:hypothetical protein